MQKQLGRPLSKDWVSTSNAASELGISRGHLLNLKSGRHYLSTADISAIFAEQMPCEQLTSGICQISKKP